MPTLETLVAWAKRRWFVYPNSDIYGGLANARDYGPYGAQLKKNLADRWTKHFVQERDDMVLIDGAIIAHPQVRQASGHTETFGDALIDDKATWQRFRADKILEERIEQDNITLEDLQGRYGIDNLIPESRGNERMTQVIRDNIPHNPDTRKIADRTEAREFNLMLKTQLGVIADEASSTYLRPETAQSIFINFKHILDTTRMRVPFGIAQIGKSFRNEITPWQFLYRTREFEQMEIEYFVEADLEQSMKHLEYRKSESMRFWTDIVGLRAENLRFREHEADELSHYSAWTFDIEYNYPRGRGELQGIANRTDYDLTQHQEHSRQAMQYQDPQTWQRYIPYVIEPSRGLSRAVMAIMLDAYQEEDLSTGGKDDSRVVASFAFDLAPVQYAIFPLIKKDDKMVELGETILRHLRTDYRCEFDLGWAIGKRYRRQDEIGTPYCITIDHQSLEDGTVTIRDRDTMEQVRVAWEEIGN